MAVPKQRKTKSRRNQRRAHISLKAPGLGICSHCGQPVLPHKLCLSCGYYKGKEVINVLAKLEKKERKQKEKEIKEQEKEQTEKKPLTLEELSKQKF